MDTGSIVKHQRQRLAWSQTHLADAAGLSLRTVQRIESGEKCAAETLLSIASALDLDVRELTAVEAVSVRSRRDAGSAARWGLALSAPAALFAASNILKYQADLPFLHDAFVSIGDWLGGKADFMISPVILLGGLVAAVLLNLPAVIQPRLHREEGKISLMGVDVSPKLGNLTAVAVAVAFLAILVGYVTMENISEWVLAMGD